MVGLHDQFILSCDGVVELKRVKVK